jgi:hypothetical protein
MITKLQPATIQPDTAAIFACALSLWQACHKRAVGNLALNLSDCYNGMDEFMRVVMRIGNLFETWACSHVEFNELNDVWPYLMEDKFGEACLAVQLHTALTEFDESDCLRAALRLRLPVIVDDKLPVPIDVTAPNPVSGSSFSAFKIQTVRNSLEDDTVVPFVPDDEPFDDEFGKPYFGLYGATDDGKLEHIADRKTYAEALKLVQKLAPGIAFPTVPTTSPAP